MPPRVCAHGQLMTSCGAFVFTGPIADGQSFLPTFANRSFLTSSPINRLMEVISGEYRRLFLFLLVSPLTPTSLHWVECLFCIWFGFQQKKSGVVVASVEGKRRQLSDTSTYLRAVLRQNVYQTKCFLSSGPWAPNKLTSHYLRRVIFWREES